ncbi:MAG: glycine cleavage system aminomethyltransferase GcvT [Candidatus Nanopelagicales bacterium]
MSQQGPLDAVHQSQGAKFADFGGWLMPLEFAGGGVLAEHRAVRESVGIFDVSHMGTLRVVGPGASDLVNSVLTNDLARIEPGQAQYSLLCNERGGVIDDLLVYLRSTDDVLLVPNASNTAAVLASLVEVASGQSEVAVEDLSSTSAIIAIQGPAAAAVVESLGLPTELGYMRFVDTTVAGAAVVVARSGYTGERGYELIVDQSIAEQAWTQALAAAIAAGGLPCGLGARDTLRTEMGYPLHGHELSPDITPVEAGLNWAVGWNKPTFVGKDALVSQRAQGPAVRLRGLRCTERAIPRADMVVRAAGPEESGDGADGAVREPVGVVTSGTFSPTARAGIALAFLNSDISVGDSVSIDVRGRSCGAQVVSPPFVDADPR